MDTRTRQYALADERDERIGYQCVLCAVGFPRGTRVGTEHHEIISKAKLRGVRNLENLYALTNIARTCQYHHHHFQYLPIVWMKAMIRLGLATADEYQLSPDWRETYPPFDCMGRFGYGDKFYRGEGERVPEALTMGLAGTGNFTRKFCANVCPFAVECLNETRAKFLRQSAVKAV